MKIAILGATSQIARDFVSCAASSCPDWQLFLFSRSKERVSSQQKHILNEENTGNFEYSEFSVRENFDLILNFVGVVSNDGLRLSGESVFSVSDFYDSMVLNYLDQHPNCKYIFLSSGAIYGNSFSSPVTAVSPAVFPINNLRSNDWYSISKLYAEAKHREKSDKNILDLRVFSYFSRSQDPQSHFLLSSVISCLKDGRVFETTATNFFRDFVTPEDFFQIVYKAAKKFDGNGALDVFSSAPVDKLTLLTTVSERFGLELNVAEDIVTWSNSKQHYYSNNYSARTMIDYEPTYTSLEGIEREMAFILPHL